MSFKKRLKKLLSEAAEMRIEEVSVILNHFGYRLVRIRGSHYMFSKPGYVTITLPVHHGRIKKRYIKTIKKVLNFHQL